MSTSPIHQLPPGVGRFGPNLTTLSDHDLNLPNPAYDEDMSAIEQAILEKLRELPAERQREVFDFASFLLNRTEGAATEPRKPFPNMYGALRDLNINVSPEAIAEARKEMWGNFPREEFFK